MTDLTQMTPAEIDERWQRALDPARELEGLKAHNDNRIKRLNETIERTSPGMWRHNNAVEELEDEDQHRFELNEQLHVALDVLQQPFKAEWTSRGGWTRYYLVAGGHLHEYSCHTLTPGRTLVGLLCEASGATRDEVVKRYDVTACTHCFPDAPVAAERKPEDDGFCKHSGEYLSEDQRTELNRRYPHGYYNMCVAPSVRCECGGYPSITKTDKVRKHKPGKPQL